MRQRSPFFYRGLQVGQVFDCQLGHASQTIQITVDVQPRYAPLVRTNSKFWNAGGSHVNLSLSGLNIAAESTEALVSGGISFATPDTLEKKAPPETSFRLYDKPEDAWLGWAPAIELKPESGAAPAITSK